MTEVGRFFDAIAYGEADQAEVQNRFRGTGILPEVGNRLTPSAPGGMFVSVADGEAMVEGFHYKNTATVTLAIANNSSGSTRIDTIVLRLNRTGNVLAVAILQGTPSAGAPALTQSATGIWELPIGNVTVASGTLSITPMLIYDRRVYSGTNAGTLQTTLVTGVQAPRINRLDNPSFRVNQRRSTLITVQGYVADRWICGLGNNNANYSAQTINVMTPSMGYVNYDTSRALIINKGTATAPAVDTWIAPQQVIEGTKALPLYGQTICTSWWSYCTKAGTFGFNLENVGTNWRYIHSWTHGNPQGWQFNYAVIPWNGTPTWDASTNAGMNLRWIAAAGSSMVHTATNQWVNVAAKYAPPDISNALSAVNDQLWIYQPKVEVGSYPTRFESPDFAQEQIQCYRYLYVEREQLNSSIGVGGQAIVSLKEFPVEMRVVPAFSVPVVPTISSGIAPTANQVGVLALSSWISGLTYSSWAAWVDPGAKSFGTYLASSTTGTGIAAGQSAILVLGSNIQAVYSAEL
jgi:hypothetical protein